MMTDITSGASVNRGYGVVPRTRSVAQTRVAEGYHGQLREVADDGEVVGEIWSVIQ